MRSRTTRCGQVRGVQLSRIGRCHDLPMFHVKQPVAARERETPRCPARPRTGQPRRHCVLTRELHRTVHRRVGRRCTAAASRRRGPPSHERQLCGPSSKTRGPPRSRAIPSSELLRGVGRPRPLPQGTAETPPRTSTRWWGARAATSRSACSAQRVQGSFGLASDASVSERRAPRTYAASTMDGRRQRMRRSASAVCSLAVVEPISNHVVPDLFHVKHVETTACSVMSSRPLRDEERGERRRRRPEPERHDPARVRDAGAPGEASAKPGPPSRERSTTYARARPLVCRFTWNIRLPSGREPSPSRVHSALRV